MSKADGKIVKIQFTEQLVGDVTGLDPPITIESINVAKNDPDGITGQIYSDSYHYSSYYGSNIYDGSTSSYWYLKYPSYPDLARVSFKDDEKYAVNKMRMYLSSYPINAFRLQASHDAVTWDDLVIDSAPNSAGWFEWEFENIIEYEYYQLLVESEHGTYGRVYELELYADIPYGNEKSFSVVGQQPLYTKVPSMELGPLIELAVSGKSVDSVDSHTLQLNTESFKNVEGQLSVLYDAAKGSLRGYGGAVASFSQAFTPEDLIRLINPLFEENLSFSLESTISMLAVYHLVIGDGPYPTEDIRYQQAKYPGKIGEEFGYEKLEFGLSDLTIVLTHVDDINP